MKEIGMDAMIARLESNGLCSADGGGGGGGGIVSYSQLSPSQKKGVELLSQYSEDIRNMALPLLLQGPGMSVIPKLYWSTVRFAPVRSGTGPFLWTVAKGVQVTAFGYKFGDTIAAAGFPATFQATRSETNLTVGGTQTNDNADVIVWGMGVEIGTQNACPDLAAALLRQVDMIMSLSQSTKFYLGPIGYYPQAGGIYGKGTSNLEAGETNNNLGAEVRTQLNGFPGQGNFRKLPSPIRWQSIGSNKKDTSLSIALTCSNDVAVPSATTVASAIDPAAWPGFTAPSAEAEIFTEFRILLPTIEVSDRSENM